MSIASNTGPLIAFAKADAFSLLKTLFAEVHIPPAVHRELLAKTGPEAQRLDEAFNDFVLPAPSPPLPPTVEQFTRNLGDGEQQAIALAIHLGVGLLIDDRQGRTAARRLGIAVIGTAGVLIQAKQAGLIPQIRAVLEEMRRNGYWLSDALVDTAARLAGE